MKMIRWLYNDIEYHFWMEKEWCYWCWILWNYIIEKWADKDTVQDRMYIFIKQNIFNDWNTLYHNIPQWLVKKSK